MSVFESVQYLILSERTYCFGCCLRARACMLVFFFGCVCVFACVRACVRARVCVCVCVRVCVLRSV